MSEGGAPTRRLRRQGSSSQSIRRTLWGKPAPGRLLLAVCRELADPNAFSRAGFASDSGSDPLLNRRQRILALAAERRRPETDEIDGVEPVRQVRRDRHDEARLAIFAGRRDRCDARADVL